VRIHSRARGWALQALYAWEVRGAEPHRLIPVLHELYEHLDVSPHNRLYADVLVRVVAQNLGAIDALLQESLSNWRLNRLSYMDRNVLRLGVAEMRYLDTEPPRYIIRDLTRLAERYGTDESGRFVHGVLEAVMYRLGIGGHPARQ
jgi:N utilization substance protein B